MSTTFELYLLPSDIALSDNPLVRVQLETYKEPVFTHITLARFQKLYPDNEAVVVSKNSMKPGNRIVMLSVDFAGEEFNMLSDLGITNVILNANGHCVNGEDIAFKLAPVLHRLVPGDELHMYQTKYPMFDTFLQKLKTIYVNCDYHKFAHVQIY